MRSVFTLLLLAVTCFAQEREIYYYMGERLNVFEQKPGTTRALITKAAAAGCGGIVGLDQWSKNGDPATDAKWRDSMFVYLDLCLELFGERSLHIFHWNGSKWHYGYPEGVETLPPIGAEYTIWTARMIPPGQKYYYAFSLPQEFTHRLFDLELRVAGSPADIRFFRDTADPAQVSKAVVPIGASSLTFHSLDNSTGWLIYAVPATAQPTRVFISGLVERAMRPDEQYAGQYIGGEGSGFFVGRTMNPDCTAAFYRVAMAQSRKIWKVFGDHPAYGEPWLSLDEVAMMDSSNGRSAGERYVQMVEAACWFNYGLSGLASWGWNDCLGGHNSVTYSRATYGMTNDGVAADVPFYGWAWNEGKPGALESELSRFPDGSVGCAVYVGQNNIAEADSAMDAHGVTDCLLFTWDQRYADSLTVIVPQLR